MSLRLLDFCLMPTHWHFVAWPNEDGQLSSFAHWLSVTHAVRWHLHHGTRGTGHLYQNRFKAFPAQGDSHFLTVCRYVERNPVRANLVTRAEEWRWSSLWWRTHARPVAVPWLSEWPVTRPDTWLEMVNAPLTAVELEALRRSVTRGAPYGSATWQTQTAQRLGLEHTLRRPGRPKRGQTTRCVPVSSRTGRD